MCGKVTKANLNANELEIMRNGNNLLNIGQR